jgi:hypothetical protein
MASRPMWKGEWEGGNESAPEFHSFWGREMEEEAELMAPKETRRADRLDGEEAAQRGGDGMDGRKE